MNTIYRLNWSVLRSNRFCISLHKIEWKIVLSNNIDGQTLLI